MRLSIFTAFVFLWFSTASAQEIAGSAERVAQGAEQRTSTASSVLNIGDTVFTNAVLATDESGAAGVVLQDGTRLTLNARSEITIDSYIYDPAGGDRFAARMGVGILRFVSGQITKPAVRIETPVVVVGIRGTDFTLDSRTPGLVRVWLEEGEIVLTPTASGVAFTFQAPAQAVCNANACRVADLDPPPRAFAAAAGDDQTRPGLGQDRDFDGGGGDDNDGNGGNATQ